MNPSTFEKLRESLGRLDERLRPDGELPPEIEARILEERTARIARQPDRAASEEALVSCIVFERSGGRYAVPLDTLEDVSPAVPIAHVPGTPDLYLGVAARQGRVIAIIDLPRLFGSASSEPREPRWFMVASSSQVLCAVAADAVQDAEKIDPRAIARHMPTFPPIVQRHLIGVTEDRTVVLDLASLVADRALRVDERVRVEP